VSVAIVLSGAEVGEAGDAVAAGADTAAAAVGGAVVVESLVSAALVLSGADAGKPGEAREAGDAAVTAGAGAAAAVGGAGIVSVGTDGMVGVGGDAMDSIAWAPGAVFCGWFGDGGVVDRDGGGAGQDESDDVDGTLLLSSAALAAP
jgi:hypothetical protein